MVTRIQCGKLPEGIGMPLDYDEQWAGTVDSKIFESAHHFRIESEWPLRIELNLDASQVPQTFQI